MKEEKKMKKVVVIIMVLLVMLVTFYGQVYADYIDPIERPGVYKPAQNEQSNNTKFIERANLVLGIIRFAGTFISVIILMVLGIKYMIGSTEEKANYKEAMVPYIIGAVMVFAIPNLIGMVYDIIVKNLY